MDTVSHNDRTTAYRRVDRVGERTVCYIHGAGGSSRVWVHQYGDPTGPSAVAPDLSGHGDSDDISAAAGVEALDAYADDVVAVCEEVGATVLCGNSMGGAIAMWIALERDLALDGLVLADTGAKLTVASEFLETLSSDFDSAIEMLHSPEMLFYDPTDELVEGSEESLRSAGQHVTVRDFETCDAFDIRDQLGAINVPALALCGEHDSLTPPSFHEYLAEELPTCTFREIKDAAHLPMIEQPESFNDAVGSFLDSI